MSFPHKDLRGANAECPRRDSFYKDSCGKCEMKVMLHCDDCKIQVTGCLCTEYERFGNDEGWRRAVDMFGEEIARERARKAGLWVPDSPRLMT